MSRADDPAEMIGVNWGSSNFRAYRIGVDGAPVDEYCEAAGVAALSREEMAAMMARLAARWPHSGSIYVSGMIGSTLGWTEVDYAEAAVGCEGLAAAASRQLGLATLLFGARALVVRAAIAKADAASYLRGLLIGSEIADALLLFPSARDAIVRLMGSEPLCRLYASALATLGVGSRRIDAREARLRGFRAVHEATGA